jgi:hypothetical protein
VGCGRDNEVRDRLCNLIGLGSRVRHRDADARLRSPVLGVCVCLTSSPPRAAMQGEFEFSCGFLAWFFVW